MDRVWKPGPFLLLFCGFGHGFQALGADLHCFTVDFLSLQVNFMGSLGNDI